jgi:predicted RNA binding protein YcfA (HicA-like mRNA interferase family)
MPIGPLSRRDLIAALRRLGYDGPRAGGSHEYMKRGGHRISIPNPHEGVISRGLVARIVRDAGVSREEWEALE